VGVEEVVYSLGYSVDSATAAIFEGAGVKLRQFSPVRVLPLVEWMEDSIADIILLSHGKVL